jgi:hypothetical protein
MAKNTQKVLTFVLCLNIALIAAYSLVKMYSEPYFCYAEAVQFYVAHGIDYDDPHVLHNLSNVHNENSRFSMDSGGYTLLLHA